MIKNKVISNEFRNFKDVAIQYPETKKENVENLFTLFSIWPIIKGSDEYIGLDIAREYSDFFTNKSGDGGIDLIFPDAEEGTLFFLQTKFSELIDNNQAIAELNKGMTTITEIESGESGIDSGVKNVYLKAKAELSDRDDLSKKIVFVSGANLNKKVIERKLKSHANYRDFEVIIINGADLTELITNLKEQLRSVDFDKVKIDEPKNFSYYDSDSKEGIFTQVSAKSLKKLWEKYQDAGLFDLNVRKYIKRKNIDDAIKETIQKNPDEFWFLNNGLTIATSHFDIDGDNIKLHNFSVVNGAQTTTLIGTNFDDDQDDFYVPTKIIMPKNELDPNEMEDFFNSISEATNSQKPINPQDLKANSREMLSMKHWLKDKNILFEIKRGVVRPKKYNGLKIKNDVLAQLIYSFVNQRPGTARSKKSSLFADASVYERIFIKPGYDNDESKQEFIVDLIRLSDKFDEVADSLLKREGMLTEEQRNAVKNGKMVMIALCGTVYNIVNNIQNPKDVIEDTVTVVNEDFQYGRFWDDTQFNEYFEKVIFGFAKTMSNRYRKSNNSTMTDYLKKDITYLEEIRRSLVEDLQEESLDKYDDKYLIFKMRS